MSVEKSLLIVGKDSRQITTLMRSGNGPGIMWLGGYMAEMNGTKATAVDRWCEKNNRLFVRFDYSGHGQSSGSLESGSISSWLEEAEHVFCKFFNGPTIIVGASMGGWLALLLASKIMQKRQNDDPATVCGIVLVAPAVDMTEEIVWKRLPQHVQNYMIENGRCNLPSPNMDKPYVVTFDMIVDGRKHLLLDSDIYVQFPVRIIQGFDDQNIGWRHSERVFESIKGNDVSLAIFKNADHAFDKDENLEFLVNTIDLLSKNIHSVKVK